MGADLTFKVEELWANFDLVNCHILTDFGFYEIGLKPYIIFNS